MSDFPQDFEPLLDSEQAAALIRIHPKTLQRYARTGLVSGLRVGKLWRFRASDLLPLQSQQNHLDAVARAR